MFRSELILLIFSALTSAQYPQNQSLKWWQTSVIYQIYPRSFQDSDGSGTGDLKGIEQRVDYFNDTGVGAVWLSPIFESPQVDFGYDVSNYTAIDPIFGTMEDLESLQKKLKSRGIKLILDFVPNHSSDQHVWFQKSIKKIDPYTDYYVWKDPIGWFNETTPIPPNNWQSSVGAGQAWKYNEERKQFYLFQFLPQQPDLNYRCRELVEEMKNVLRFFLDKGIDGFRCDAVPFLFEDKLFRNESFINGAPTDTVKYELLNHTYTMNQPETFDVLREMREVVESYPDRCLLTEGYTDIENTMKYYGTVEKPIADIPFNFFFILNLNDSSEAKVFNDLIYLWLNNLPEGKWPNWVIGNHDNPRVSARFQSSFVDAINILILLLPGTAVTYQGEEIGMQDTKIRPDQGIDKVIPSRDGERTPFQWDSTLNAGFSSNETGTWLPVNPNYYTLNLEKQRGDPKSHYNVYTQLIKLRQTPVFQTGDFSTCIPSKWIFSFKRSLSESESFVMVLNMNNQPDHVNLTACENMPNSYSGFEVRIASGNSEYNIGDRVAISGFRMRPKSAVVLQPVLP